MNDNSDRSPGGWDRGRTDARLEPGLMLGGFKLTSLLSHGSMGEAWKARDEIADRDVVIKFIPPEIQRSEDEMRRIKEAFGRIQNLHHQHICPLLLLGLDPRWGYHVVMLHVRGRTLAAYRREYVERHGSFPASEAQRVLAPVAAALDYAHSHRVIHRDIKPENILVVNDGESLDIQVLNLGLAAEIQWAVSRVSAVHRSTSGSYPYMAPEQWRGKCLDAATDQYALGVVAYELLAGRLPFEAPDPTVLRMCVLNEQPDPIPGQPAEVNATLLKALSKEREERHPTCSEFITHLHDIKTATAQIEKPASKGVASEPKRISFNCPHCKRTLRPPSRMAGRRTACPKCGGAIQIPDAVNDSYFQTVSTSSSQPVEANCETSAPLSGKIPVLNDRGFGHKILTFVGHEDSVESVAVSPDGRWVLTGSADRTAILWDAVSGQRVHTLAGHADAVWTVAFSPNGQWVLTGSADTTAILWDAATGRKVEIFRGHSSDVWSVAFRPDGRQFLTASADETAILWDANSGQKVRVIEGDSGVVYSATFSPDGWPVLIGTRDDTSMLWDLVSGQKVWGFAGHSDLVLSVALSPNGRQLLTGSWDNSAALWDTATGRRGQTFTGHTSDVWSVVFSPNQSQILTGSADNTAILWDVDSGQKVHMFDGHTDTVKAVAFSPDGRKILTGSVDMTAILWNTYELTSGSSTRVAARQPHRTTNSIGMELILISAGEYKMGSSEAQVGRGEDEGPQCYVRITRPFYLGKYQVTQAEYMQVMGKNPSYFKGDMRPVENVSWHDAVEFCRRLSEKEKRQYRLPTEAEWEYACRAGTQSPFSFGDALNGVQANCDGNYPYGMESKGRYKESTVPVGTYPPNAWGLCDMHGNVWEWCSDWYGADYYTHAPTDDPQGPSSGSARVIRGGAWGYVAGYCRSATRNHDVPGNRGNYLGFRVALVAE